MAEQSSAAKPFDIGECFNAALEVYRKNVVVLVFATFVFELFSVLTLLILSGAMSGGYFLMMLNAMRREDRKADLNDLFRMFWKFLPLLGLVFLQGILIAAGFVLLVVPGLLLATMWLYSIYRMVDKNEGAMTSMRSSWDLVKKKGVGSNLLVCVLYIVLAVAGNMVRGFGWAISLFLMPLGTLMVTAAYLRQAE
jgi:hypothetical protein